MNAFPMNNTDHYAHGSPHSPHTIPDRMVQPPEYSPLRLESYPLDHTSSTAVTKNSPHTTPLRFDSPNANPQLGQAQLDFIPMPNSPPSAPAHFSTTIPDADDDAKYETSMSTPLTMSDPKHSSPKPAHPYPTPTPAPSSHIDQRENLENVTIVDAVPVDERYKKKSPDGNNFFKNVRDPRKKTFWAVTIIFLAIFFGILGATVWKPDNKAAGVPSQEMFECLQKCLGDQQTCCEDNSATCGQTCPAKSLSCLQGCQSK